MSAPVTARDLPGAPGTGRRPLARIVLLAGASGSGKTRLTRRLGVTTVALDDFYRDVDDPVLQRRFPPGTAADVDWDDPVSWDGDAARAALSALCHEGWTDLPVYDIPTSRRTGTRRLQLGPGGVVVAEGIFAAELVRPLAQDLLLADAICLSRDRVGTFVRRLLRDLHESRKSPGVLIRRGLRLAGREPLLVRRWTEQGCRPLSRDRARVAVHRLQALPGPPAACFDPTVDLPARLRTLTAEFARVSDLADPAAPVTHCPGWTVRDLIGHLGGIHRWVRTAVVDGYSDESQPQTVPEGTAPGTWYRDGAADMLAALGGADASDPAWTFAPPATVGFWWRRQTHETAVHLWDLTRAAGVPFLLDAPLAGDGIDEVLTMFWPRQVARGRAAAPPAPVALAPTDAPGSWVLGDPAVPDAAPVATVSGPAERLYLLLWGRAGLDDPALTVTGEVDAARTALDRAIVP